MPQFVKAETAPPKSAASMFDASFSVPAPLPFDPEPGKTIGSVRNVSRGNYTGQEACGRIQSVKPGILPA